MGNSFFVKIFSIARIICTEFFFGMYGSLYDAEKRLQNKEEELGNRRDLQASFVQVLN